MFDQNIFLHNSHQSFYRYPFGAAVCGSEVTLSLKVASLAQISSVRLRFFIDGEDAQELSMQKNTLDECYKINLVLPNRPCLVWYCFEIESAGEIIYYGNNAQNFGGIGELYTENPPCYQITVYDTANSTPNWFKEVVIYQIFVDRFYKSDQVLSPKRGSLIHGNWDDSPLYIKDKNGKVIRWSFFGGNLLGVREKLPYLKSLGIKVIYFNPIFEAPSNHKYDTADYLKIDSMFGDNKIFTELCSEARGMGISIILDGVFSHTGSDSIYFNEQGNYEGQGAFQSQLSPYYNWYRFKNYPKEYESWWGIETLPSVNELEPSYLDFIIYAENSVLKYWLKLGARGWRLDVADELPDTFIKEYRSVLKQVDPDNVLIGEVWEDASNKISYGQRREYLYGNELDGAMNYPLRSALLSFFVSKASSDWLNLALLSQYENYPKQNFYCSMNLLGSHDVPRLLTVLKNSLPAELALEQRQSDAIALMKLITLCQMTFPGVPSIYYGDEAGLEGRDDPFNRAAYPWGSQNIDLIRWYKQIVALRNHYDVFKTGAWHTLSLPETVFGFVRSMRGGRDKFGQTKVDNTAVVLVNRHIKHPIEFNIDIGTWCSGEMVDVFNDYAEVNVRDGVLSLKLEPLESKVLLQDRWGSHLQSSRQCGILLHITSLPSKHGIGDLGSSAYEFIDFLAKSGQQLWQILPLNPPGLGDSPYQTYSAFAGNPLLIDLEILQGEGLLEEDDFSGISDAEFDSRKVEFAVVSEFKSKMLRKAFGNFRKQLESDEKIIANYTAFVTEQYVWLHDFALFMALRTHFEKKAWTEWEEPIRHREPETLKYFAELLSEEIDFYKFVQFKFHTQWKAIKGYAVEKGIQIIGDLPFFVAIDSCDVWVRPANFLLDETLAPTFVAGVPPDYFSATGQRWGNPVYNWSELENNGYTWWLERIRALTKLVDIIRIDHFRGFEACWSIPAEQETAVYGSWVKGGGNKFFDALRNELGDISVIAENLGFITDEVEAIRIRYDYPGIKVLQFTVENGKELDFRVELSEQNTACYTGTHDNDTLFGWLGMNHPEMSKEELKQKCWQLIERVYRSDAARVILPLQDFLSLDSDARMNTPGTPTGNWTWRLSEETLTEELAQKIGALALKYCR